jgi:small GTP-binding protein
MRTPSTLRELRRFVASLDWEDMMAQVEQETHARLAIVGPVNAGKSTLFNTLAGRDVSPISAVPGTTRQLVADWFGPFVLVDTPGFGEATLGSPSGTGSAQGRDDVNRAQVALQAVTHAAVVVLLLDAAAGLRRSDRELYRELVATGRPVVIALNKMDLVGRDRTAVLADAHSRLGTVQIIPISAKRGDGVANVLMPSVFEADPSLAVAVGRSLPAYRRLATRRLIRNAAIFNAVIGAEPIPGLDLPLLLTSHVRLVLRIAAIYGETISPERARELIATMAGGVLLRYLGIEAAKFIPGPGWLVAGAMASISTVAIGQVAVRYFESGKRLTPQQLRDLYRQYRRRKC